MVLVCRFYLFTEILTYLNGFYQAAPGLDSPATTTVPGAMGLGAQGGATDPNAAAGQTTQGQWAGTDPNSYYSNYWGGR